MKKYEEEFLLLTEYVATGKKNEEYEWTGSEWPEIYQLAMDNKLVANTCDYIKELNVVPEDIRQRWDKYRLYTFINQKKCFNSLKSLVEEFTSKEISYALFKGFIIANLYTNPYYRISSDSDILVSESQREAATAIIIEHGYIIEAEDCKDTVVTTFINEEVGHKIELHTSLFEDYEGKKIDLLNSMNLDDNAKRVSISIDGVDFVTLGHEEHLVYQLFHFIKHFIVEGVSIRYLIDITLFINKYYEAISWESFWDKMTILGYDKFARRFFSICQQHYGLKSEVMSIKNEDKDLNAEEIILLDLIYKGNSQGHQQKRYHLKGYLNGYLVGEKEDINESSLYKKIKKFFPKQRDINDYYAYAKKHKFLVPVAWVHRIFHSIHCRLNKEETYTMKEKAAAISEREQLYVKFGLFDGE